MPDDPDWQVHVLGGVYGAAIEFKRNPSGAVDRLAYRDISAPHIESRVPSLSDLEAYVGSDHCAELDIRYDLLIQNGQLLARSWRRGDAALLAVGADQFRGSTWWASTLEFEWDEKGTVGDFLLSYHRVQKLRFSRCDD